jgi:TP901 family phage tail tape measure protein
MAGIKINILSNFNASGFDKLQRDLKRLDTPMEKLGATTRALAPAATIALGALAIGATKAVGSANDLALGLREVVTLTGETGDEANKTFGQLQGLVRTVSNEFAIAQDVLTKGLYQALSAGVPKDNALEFMQVASKAAIAGVTDVDTAVDGLTTTINAFGLDIGQAGNVADSMFAAVKGGKTTFGELSASLFNVAPAAAAAKVSFAEVNAAIATLTASGVPTSVATTQIRAAFVALSKPSKELTALFNSLGYESGEAAIAQNGLGFAMDAVFKASNGSASQMKLLLGRQEAVNAINVLAGTSAGKFADELERQAAAAGSVDDAFNEIDKSRTIEKQKIAFENLSLAIGTVLIPIMEAVIPLFTGFAQFAEENATVVTILAGVLGVLAAAILAVNFALNANPIVKVITLIAALVTGVILLINYLVNLGGGWSKLFENIKVGLTAVGEFFTSVFEGVANFMAGIINGMITRFENFINTVIGGLNGIIALANTALAAISAATGGAVNIKVPTVPKVTLPKVPTKAPKQVKIPKLANGGIVMPRPGGVLANIAEAGQAEAVIPLDRMKGLGKPSVVNNYNITVSGGVGSGATIGKAIVEQIKAYERTSGQVFAGV